MGDNPRFYSYDGESYAWFDTLAEAKAEAAAQLAGFRDAAIGDGEWNDLVDGVSWGVEIGGVAEEDADGDAVDYALEDDADGLVARLAAALREARPLVREEAGITVADPVRRRTARELLARIDTLLVEMEIA